MTKPHGNRCRTVASEGRLRDAGAEQVERTRQYVSIASTAETRDAERSRFIIKRLLLDVHALQVATHRPQRFLAEEVGHLRHVHTAITHRAVDHP